MKAPSQSPIDPFELTATQQCPFVIDPRNCPVCSGKYPKHKQRKLGK